jgi:outer membrane murein-binding lipoprotein Lpp
VSFNPRRRNLSPIYFAVFCMVLLCGRLGLAEEEGGSKAQAVDEKPWVQVQNRVLTLRTQRMQLLQKMADLRQEKTQTQETPAQVKAKMDELVSLYKEYREATNDYNKQLVVLKYRYPEQLAKEDARDYKQVEVESLEQLEGQLDIEGHLSKVYNKAQSQYRAPQERAPYSPLFPDKRGPGNDTTIREKDPILLSH